MSMVIVNNNMSHKLILNLMCYFLVTILSIGSAFYFLQFFFVTWFEKNNFSKHQ